MPATDTTWWRWLALVTLLAACSSQPNEPSAPTPTGSVKTVPERTRVEDAGAAPMDAAPQPPTSTRQATAIVVDRDTLAALEQAGFAFGGFFGTHGKQASELYQSERYRRFADALAKDVQDIKKRDPRAGVGLRFAHRLFDRRFLWAKNAHWDLTAIVPRLDRLSQREGHCGDIRLSYRLAYESAEGMRIRLPLTAIVIVPGETMAPDCRKAALRFSPPSELVGAKLAAWLLSEDGGLHPGLKSRPELGLLSNMQAVRWPSTVMPDLGGHAEYILRQWKISPTGLQAEAAFATPNTKKIAARPALRQQLRRYLERKLNAQNSERLPLPPELSTMRSVAVTPGGFSRRQNRPFSEALGSKPLPVALRNRLGLTSEAGLRRRLDEGTCAGCHQARTIAGFHLLGLDPPNTPAPARLAVPYSKHLANELVRRKQLMRQLLRGSVEASPRGFTQRGAAEPGVSGVPCTLGDSSFRDWTCNAGLTCNPQGDSVLGVCASKDSPTVGEACEPGTLRSFRLGRRDRIRTKKALQCASGSCITRKNGFPDGMCMTSCEQPGANGTCGQIASSGFDRCISNSPFPQCLRENVSPTGLRACSVGLPCRDDYICAQTHGGTGACVPPYFLFQLRVDGHPPPR